MKNQFKITGFYYEELGFKFRKYLDIKKVDTDIRTPDLMVIMMNPGSSRPVDGIENNTKESLAIPDRTQDQIMKVMLNSNLQYARILNLSDLREAKSNIFYTKIIELENKGISHSIFDENRQDDFNHLWEKIMHNCLRIIAGKLKARFGNIFIGVKEMSNNYIPFMERY